jgi:hypothetical protein
MRLDQQIRVNTLLLEREGLFVRVHELEQRIEALLGGPYPFERPRLPSDQKTKRKGAAPRAEKSAGHPTELKPEPGEERYRIHYRHGSQAFTEEHVNLKALERLLASQSSVLQVLRIEALDASGGGRRTLFELGSGGFA